DRRCKSLPEWKHRYGWPAGGITDAWVAYLAFGKLPDGIGQPDIAVHGNVELMLARCSDLIDITSLVVGLEGFVRIAAEYFKPGAGLFVQRIDEIRGNGAGEL